ncbi:MAG: alpha-L-fucosidase [Bacteroidales bacterium]|nr:alpha-L-fucosidase [Bacteroidales bacterium]
MLRFFLFLALLLLVQHSMAQSTPPEPFGPIPTDDQVRWQRMEMNMFCHFGPNTFSGLEWGEGTEAEDMFCPTQLDCDQWTAVARAAGFRGIIITAKHHDGFCLWPNPASNHTVRQSKWQGGKGDVLRELSRACRKANLKFGIYISPWDRNAPTYGTPEYNNTFRQTLEHALTHYGPIFEQWFDGACGEGPNGKRQEYDWPLFNSTVLRYQPNALIFSDVGPGCHWMGNENAVNGETCWSRLSTHGFAPGKASPSLDTLNQGQRNGQHWIPAEADVSIRPGWFYHASEHPKSLHQLLSIYYTSVGRNALLLLNVPPDNRGLIPAEDSTRLVEFRQALNAIFRRDLTKGARALSPYTRDGGNQQFAAHHVLDTNYHSYWTVDDTCLNPTLDINLLRATTFNRIMLQEYIPLGQRVEAFEVWAMQNGIWRKVSAGTTIGYKRILLTQPITTHAIRIRLTGRACPVINRVALFMDNIYEEN